MRMMKVRGLTRDRGVTDTSLVYFTSALPPCIPIMEVIEKLAGTSAEASEQHAAYKDHNELRSARQQRDATDTQKFVEWLNTRNPFDQKQQAHLIQ